MKLQSVAAVDPFEISLTVESLLIDWRKAKRQYEDKYVNEEIERASKGGFLRKGKTLNREQALKSLDERFYTQGWRPVVALKRIDQLKRIVLLCKYAMEYPNPDPPGVVYLSPNDLAILDDHPDKHQTLPMFGVLKVVEKDGTVRTKPDEEA